MSADKVCDTSADAGTSGLEQTTFGDVVLVAPSRPVVVVTSLGNGGADTLLDGLQAPSTPITAIAATALEIKAFTPTACTKSSRFATRCAKQMGFVGAKPL